MLTVGCDTQKLIRITRGSGEGWGGFAVTGRRPHQQTERSVFPWDFRDFLLTLPVG